MTEVDLEKIRILIVHNVHQSRVEIKVLGTEWPICGLCLKKPIPTGESIDQDKKFQKHGIFPSLGHGGY